MPQAPSVGDSQLSSSKRMSCCRGLMPHASRLSRYSCCTSSGAGLRITWNWWCLNRRFGFSPNRPSAGRRDGWTYATFQCAGPEHAEERLGVHRAGADLDVERLLQHTPARRPELRELEDEVLKRHPSSTDRLQAHPAASSVISSPHLAQHAHRFQILLEVHRNQRPMRGLELAQRPRETRAPPPSANGLHAARPRPGTRAPRPTAARIRLVHALQPQQPVLEVPRQRLDRHTRAIASTIDAPSRNSVSFGSASCAHSSISSAK